MIVNRDQQETHRDHISFKKETDHEASSFVGKVDIATFGKDQYHWHPGDTRFVAHAEHAGEFSVVANTKGTADPDGPIVHTNQIAGKDGRMICQLHRSW
ncbi:MAG: coagulation factor 5/8 type domain protein [Acidobacteriaceae bacterium]|nr:coagulation factor 5/8 type domain protein [Acidobacteriaceae bacterium]